MHLQKFHPQPAGCKLRQQAIRRSSAAAGCQQHAAPHAGGEFRQLLQYAAPEDDARGSCKLEQRLDIIFLRKIVPGRSDRSYGIQVARLAGLPASVVSRAKEILLGLESDELSRGGRPTLSGAPSDVRTEQLGLFATRSDDEITQRIKAVDIDDTTPRQALELLAALKKLADKE